MSQRHRGYEAEPTLQLQVQERHEEGKELSPDLLEHISEFTGYVLTWRKPFIYNHIPFDNSLMDQCVCSSTIKAHFNAGGEIYHSNENYNICT